MKQFWPILVLICLVVAKAQGQKEYNQYDDQGRRHGEWRKYYDQSDQLRYQGRFEHGKEVGTFKFYCPNCKSQPAVVKEFREHDAVASVRFYTLGGKLSSSGQMIGRDRIGEWLFYHEDGSTVMSREHYDKGKLHGNKVTYYPNGKKTEEVMYQNGILQGPALYYSPDGVLLKELRYHQNELHGPATYYDAHGNVVIRGHYKAGAKNGLWQYFENGNKVMEETYPKKYRD